MSKKYARLIAELPLRSIRSDRVADRAGRLAFQLATQAKLARDEQDYLDVLTALIEAYEEEHHPIPDVDSPREILRFLLEENGLTRTQLSAETGIAISTLSELLSGRRDFNVQHIAKLSHRFSVDPGLWISSMAHADAG